MNLKKIKKKHWLWAVGIFILFIYLQQGGNYSLQAAVCPEGDTMCRIKEQMQPVKDWILDHILLTAAIILMLGFFVYSFDIGRKGG